MGGTQSVTSSTNALSENKTKKSRNIKYTCAEAGKNNEGTRDIKRDSSNRHSQPVAKKPPPNKRRTNYEDLIAESESLSNERYREKRREKLNEEDLIKERNDAEDIKEQKLPKEEKFKPPPPIENGDIVPLFPGESSTENKGGDKEKEDKEMDNDKKNKTEDVPAGTVNEINDESGELEYYEHRLDFNEEDSEDTDYSDANSDTNSERSKSTEHAEVGQRRLKRAYSSSSSSTLSNASERARSKATEKPVVPSDSDREDIHDEDDKNAKSKEKDEAEKDRLTSRIYVVPETKPRERQLKEKADFVVEPDPPEDNIFVIHMFEKDKQKKNQPMESTDIFLKPKDENTVDVASNNNGENRHIVKLQLYPGVEYYKTVIRMDKNSEDVSHLRDVFLKDAIITDD